MNSFVQQTSPLGCSHTAKRHTLTFADLESKWIPLRDPQPVYVIDNIAIALSFWGKTHTALVVHPYMTLNPDKPWICNLDHLFNLIEGFVYLFMPIYFYLKNAKHLDYRYMKKALIQSLTDTLSMYDAFCRSQFLAKGRLTSHWQAWVTVPIWDLIMWRGHSFRGAGEWWHCFLDEATYDTAKHTAKQLAAASLSCWCATLCSADAVGTHLTRASLARSPSLTWRNITPFPLLLLSPLLRSLPLCPCA